MVYTLGITYPFVRVYIGVSWDKWQVCSVNSNNVNCSASGLNANANQNGNVNANDDSSNCEVNEDGMSNCNE